MRLIQINLNHCEAAQDLLRQTVIEAKADVAIISEQYASFGDSSVFSADASDRAAVWACGKHGFQETGSGMEAGFARARINGIHVYSCYAPPSASIDEFQIFLDRLTNDARDRYPLIIAGDFNAWAVEWGGRTTNRRGTALLEAFARLQVTLVNMGSTPTFRRGSASSVVDITFMSDCLASRAVWRVSEHYTHSDHQAIVIDLVDQSHRNTNRPRSRKSTGWKAKSFDEATFLLMLEETELSGSADN